MEPVDRGVDTIYREMLSVALEQSQQRKSHTHLALFLFRRCQQLEAELSRYTASMVSNAPSA